MLERNVTTIFKGQTVTLYTTTTTVHLKRHLQEELMFYGWLALICDLTNITTLVVVKIILYQPTYTTLEL